MSSGGIPPEPAADQGSTPARTPEGGAGPVRVLALINRQAGRLEGSRIREAITQGMEGSGASVDFVEITPERRARDVTAGAAGQGYHIILVAGGDGTLAEAAAGLVGTDLPIGIIPAGTGNIVATNLGIPASPRLAARAALTGKALPFDVGRISDGRIFLLAAGAGYDADLVRDADRELKRRFGPLAYLFAMAKNLRVKRARFMVELDGEKRLHFHAKTVLVCNVGRTMGSLPLAPDARVDDGCLDVVVFTFAGFGQLLVLFLKAILGWLKYDPRVRFLKARRVRLTASRPMPVQMDGEFAGMTTPLEVSVIPGGLRIIRPPRPAIDLASLAENALKAIRDFPARLTDEGRHEPQVPVPADRPKVD